MTSAAASGGGVGGDVPGGDGSGGIDPSAGMGGLDPGLGMGADTSGFGGGGLSDIAAQVTGPQSSDPTGSLGAQQAIQGGMQGNQPPLTDQPTAAPPPSQPPQAPEPQRYGSASEALFKGFQDKEYPGLSSTPGYAEVGQSDVGDGGAGNSFNERFQPFAPPGATTGQAAPGGLPKLPPMPPSYSQPAPGGLPKLPPESPQSNVPTPQPRPTIPTPQPRPSPGQDLPVPATAPAARIPGDLATGSLGTTANPPSVTPPATPPATSPGTTAPGMGGGMGAGGPLEQLVGQFLHMLLGGGGGIGGMLEQMIDRALGINPQRMFPQYYGGGFNPPPPSPGSGYFPPGATGGRPATAGGAGTGTPPLPQPGPSGSQGNQPSALRPDEFISSRGGHTAGTGAPNLNPELASRLAAAGQAYENETGQKAQFGETGRSRDLQAKYYQEFRRTGQGLAAPPGMSRHEMGLATDVPSGPFQNWLHKNGARFGIEGLRDQRDPFHFQLASNAAPLRSTAQQTVSGDINQSNFERTFAKTPLAGKYSNIAQVARANGVPPKLMASIIAYETGRGTSRLLREFNNPAGISGRGGYQKFPTIEAGLEAAGRVIGNVYRQSGGSIWRMGNIYAPPGARNDPRGTNREWPSSVMRFQQSL